MQAVKVQYTVQESYIEENKKNIQRVMYALRANPIEGMLYSSYTDHENPSTFIHINMAKDGETMSKLNNVPEFSDFRMALKASGPISPPKQTSLDTVGAAFDID